MKKTLALVIFILILSGCSSLKVSHDIGPDASFSSLETFSFQPHTAANRDTLNEDRIIKAIKNSLESKGYRFSETRPANFKIQFQLESIPNVPSNVSFGLGLGSFSGNLGGSIGTSHRKTYNQDTIVIDLLSPANGKLLWRGTATDKLNQAETPEQRQIQINKLVNAILQPFPN
jgi:hypothetical protein